MFRTSCDENFVDTTKIMGDVFYKKTYDFLAVCIQDTILYINSTSENSDY